MTAYRFVTLGCDGTNTVDGDEYRCGEICDPGMATTVREARLVAAGEGWRRVGGRDMCPLHFGYTNFGFGWVKRSSGA